jgi:hypothetical protein
VRPGPSFPARGRVLGQQPAALTFDEMLVLNVGLRSQPHPSMRSEPITRFEFQQNWRVEFVVAGADLYGSSGRFARRTEGGGSSCVESDGASCLRMMRPLGGNAMGCGNRSKAQVLSKVQPPDLTDFELSNDLFSSRDAHQYLFRLSAQTPRKDEGIGAIACGPKPVRSGLASKPRQLCAVLCPEL